MTKKCMMKPIQKLPPNAKKIGDTGYQGTDLIHPVKKKRGESLSKSQKKIQ